MLDLTFPFLDPYQRYPASIVAWWPEAPSGAPMGCRDIAILHLDNSPARARTVPGTTGPIPSETPCKVHGFPRPEGHWAYGKVRDARADGWIQISGESPFTYPIEPGFSGAPVTVEDRGIERAIGIVAMREPEPTEREAFAIPMACLERALESIELANADPKTKLLKAAVADVRASLNDHRPNNTQMAWKIDRVLKNLDRALDLLASLRPEEALLRLSAVLRPLYEDDWQRIEPLAFQAIDLNNLIKGLERLGAETEEIPRDYAGRILNDMQDEPPHWRLIELMHSEIETLEKAVKSGVGRLDEGDQRRLLDTLGDLDSELLSTRIDLNRLVQLRSDLEEIRSAQNRLRHLLGLHETFLGEYVALLPPLAIFRDLVEAPPMVVIPSGRFLMGSPADEEGRRSNEGPQHEVSLAYRFAVGRYPVTFEEYDRFTDETGREPFDDREWGRGRQPVIAVESGEAGEYLAWLSEKTGHTYRLLSEAEWEYACRAGTTTRYWWGDEITPANANYEASGIGKTTEVGSYPANPWGLGDMHGNVWEWLQDRLHDNYEGAPADGSAWSGGWDAAVRGGSWFDAPDRLRAAYRGSDAFAQKRSYEGVRFGFRVARTQPRSDEVG